MRQLVQDIFLSLVEKPETSGITLYECRLCGTKFDQKRNYCTSCGTTEIAGYSLESHAETD